MSHPLVTVAVLLALALGIVLLWLRERRRQFGPTLRRCHPELQHQVDAGLVELGRVAGRAIDVRTPPAPRRVAADLEVV